MDATDIGMEAANKYLVRVMSNIMLWILQEYLAPFAPYSTLHLRALESSNPLNCEFLWAGNVPSWPKYSRLSPHFRELAQVIPAQKYMMENIPRAAKV